MDHILYTDADADRPDVICDRNGEVVLACCKACGLGESELDDKPECDPKTYYREVNAQWSDDVLAISCNEFRVVARTPKGRWIAPTWDTEAQFKRFVLDGEGKRYAYPTREAARASFIIRKQKEIQHTARQHDRAVRYLALAKTGKFGTRTEALHEIQPAGGPFLIEGLA